MKTDSYSDDEIKDIYDLKKIAIVGLSRNSEKPSNSVSKYMIRKGFTIVPVNPHSNQIIGLKSFKKVSDININIDIVNVFRKSEDLSELIPDLIKKKNIKILWLQEGIYNYDVEKIVTSLGIKVIYNRCIMKEHIRLF